MIRLPVIPNVTTTVSILDRTTLRKRINTLRSVDSRAIQWHQLNRMFYLLETKGDAEIVLAQITLEDGGDPTPTTHPPINITRAMGDTGVILWEYRKDNDKPAVIMAWYFAD